MSALQLSINVPVTIEALRAIKNNADGPEVQAFVESAKQAAAQAVENIEITTRPAVPVKKVKSEFIIPLASPNSGNHQLRVTTETTLKEVMQMIEGCTGVPIPKQRLFLGTLYFCDGATVTRFRAYAQSMHELGIRAGDEIAVYHKE